MRKAHEKFRSSVLEKSGELRQLGTQKNKGKMQSIGKGKTDRKNMGDLKTTFAE